MSKPSPALLAAERLSRGPVRHQGVGARASEQERRQRLSCTDSRTPRRLYKRIEQTLTNLFFPATALWQRERSWTAYDKATLGKALPRTR